MDVQKTHKHIVSELRKKAGTANAGQSSDSYTGSQHTFYAVPVPERRAILKEVISIEKKTATVEDWLALVDTLIVGGKSHEEKSTGAYIVGYLPEVRKAASFARIDAWLSHLIGWAEVDALCQSNFNAAELLEGWNSWKKFLLKLSKDKNINKRRASLVFLTGPTSKSVDKQLHDQAFEIIDSLKHEKDILITKAISWLLRSQADSSPQAVKEYLNNNSELLPKIAVRETLKKLRTGKKN